MLRYVYTFNQPRDLEPDPLPPLDGGQALPVVLLPAGVLAPPGAPRAVGAADPLLFVFSGATRYIMGPLFNLMHALNLAILSALL